ncbi:metalloregulator ArsR/SmtB family transcription factor [Bacillus sp. ISL-45]|uniref:ArsR/SmtB family transcription factor n=1 Tax=Bacillus sp. ISL-45 TaxID=2819128 RepID=UPI001BEB227E|nr:metalloregulator ArsR/SmtB family transcription factor [Bacillus sp. ISL-45]MBT2663331.1 winged helix-turn-helix transcriptional regulator [Bacillus sp. ISL-45]
MSLEWDSRSKADEVVVEHFHSTVVEYIAFTSSLLDARKEQDRLYGQLLKELDKNSAGFLDFWETKTDWSFTFLFNFLLPCPYFHDVELFLEKISTLSDPDFLYHFFGESLPEKQIKELIKDPEKLMSYEDTIWWETDEKKSTIQDILKNLPDFRNSFITLLLDVSQSRIIKDELAKVSNAAQDSIDKVKSIDMEPLALAQYIMGKTFRRTSLYQVYYFIPSYFFAANRIRIFDSKTCIIIYGVDAPLVDYRKKSAELEVQLKALSDRNRILILRMLARNKEYGAKIAEYLGITTATVSHHLELLKKAGFVKEEKVGTIKYFSYNQEHAEATLKQLQEFINPKL